MKVRKILAILLALAMAFSMFSVTAFAEGNGNVAEVGGVGYATLEAAVAAANAGGNQTITILQDVDFSSENLAQYKWVDSDVNPLKITASGVTLDLNGHRFYNMGNCALGFGSIFSRDGTIASGTIMNGTLEAGTTGGATNSYVLLLGGVDNIEISNITTNGGINVCAGTNATISDCVINGTKYYTVCSQTGSHVVINGTTFTKNTKSMDSTVATDKMFWVQGAGTDEDCITDSNPTGAFDASSITIFGGTYGANPSAYVAPDYEAVSNGDGTWTVKSIYAAQIGENKYLTLAEAVAAAQDNDVITMLADDTVSLTGATAEKIISIDKNITITGAVDANGDPLYTVYGTNTFKAARNGISVTGDKDVTISNIKLAQFGNAAATGSYSGIVRAEAEYTGTFTLENVAISEVNRNAILIKGGNFLIDNCYIDCSKSYGSSILTKGIEVQNDAAGTISNTVIVGATTSSTTSTAAIELYHNSNVVIDSCDLTSNCNGICASGTNTAKCNAVAVINDTVIHARYGIYTRDNADFTVNGGEIVVTDSAESKDKGIWTTGSATLPVKVNGTVITGTYVIYIGTSTGGGVIVTDGEFNGRLYKFGADTVCEISGGTFFGDYALGLGTGASGPVLSGGAFSRSYSQYVLADGYELCFDGNYYVVCPVGTAVAQIGAIKYTTLEAAVEAANAGDTVTLLADIDYSEVTKNRNAHDRGEELKIDLKDLTLDLNGNTISTVNASVVFTGNGATIENGSFALVHIKSNGAYQAGSYGLCLDAYGQETDITLNNLDVEGGINVWGAKVTINDVNAVTTASKFYAVWAEGEGAVVTINSGIFTDAQSGGTGILATGTGAEGGAKLYINGGTFNATNNLVSSAEANSIKIAGGTYDKDPTAYVADGYEAVSNGTWTVGKIVAKAISESAATTEGYDATYTATKQVVDDDNNVLSTGNSVKVDVVAVTEDTVASDTTIAKIDVSAILDDIVAAAGEADEVSVKIKIVSDTPEVVENTITYEVHPEAETYVNDSLVANVKIGNSALKDNASFTITLAVPDALVANGFVQVTHRSEDFGDETKVCAVEGEAGGYYVVLEVTHFSEFELKKIDNIIDANDMATWGASLLLEDDVKINVYVENLKDMSGNTEANPGRYKLVYTFNGVTNEAYLTSAASNSVIVARCAAKQLADVVTLELYYDDILIKSNTYSAKKYCDDAIDGNWDEKDVCAALLEFGGYAQIRFDYNTDNMANAVHSLGEAPYTTVPDSYSYSIDGYYGAVVAAFGASLSLESKTELNIYFTPYANSLDGYTAYVNGNEIGIVQVNPDGDVAGIITVPGIVAKDLAEEIAIEISNGSASFTLNYSPIAHAQRCQDDVAEGNLFKAMYLYHLAAKTYFENKNS